MKKNTANIVKGVGIGLTVGAAMGVAGSCAFSSSKKLKKTAVKALKGAKDMFGSVENMLK